MRKALFAKMGCVLTLFFLLGVTTKASTSNDLEGDCWNEQQVQDCKDVAWQNLQDGLEKIVDELKACREEGSNCNGCCIQQFLDDQQALLCLYDLEVAGCESKKCEK